MIEQHVVVYELSMDNIVLADDDHGRRFVCVDGMGSRPLIPVQEWSKWLNGQKIREFRSSLLSSIDGPVHVTALRLALRGLKFLPEHLPALQTGRGWWRESRVQQV